MSSHASSPPSTRPWSPARPLLIAHRGDSRDCPENTAAAFDAAVRAGVDGIELDLRPTSDGQVVVCHDASLARFHGGFRPLARRSLRELQQVDVGSWFSPHFHDQRLVSLDALLEGYRHQALLLLELKAAAGLFARARNRRLCAETVRAIHRHRAGPQVLILCFSSALLAHIAQLDPHLRLVRNCLHPPHRLDHWLARQPPLHAIDLDHRQLSPRLVAQCHARDVRVFTWSCNTLRDLTRVRGLGVDGILSDRPGWLCSTVRAHG